MVEQNREKIRLMVMTGLMMCLIMVMTFIIRIPVPATQGYVHLGDCMIFMGVLLLGWKFGGLAAGVGSALADLLGGYAFYAPITLVVKGLMALVMGWMLTALMKKAKSLHPLWEAAAMAVGGMVMVAGYYVAESILYGNGIAPLAAIPMNVLQFAVGIVIAVILVASLRKTRAKKYFTL